MQKRQNNLIRLPYIIAPLWSVVFLCSVCGLPADATFFLKPLLACLTIGALFWVRHSRGDKKTGTAVALLLFAIMEDYWFWLFFARYDTTSGYGILIATEILRLSCILLLTFSCIQKKLLHAVFVCFSIKLVIDAALVFLRWDYSFTSHPLYHTDFPSSLFVGLHVLLQICLFALAVVKSGLYENPKPLEDPWNKNGTCKK